MAEDDLDFAAFNKGVIEEFRANRGVVGGTFKGIPLMLITTKGAKSGKERVTPLVYVAEGDRIFVAASYAGFDQNPAWYHNLLASPVLTVEVGPDRYEATFTEIADDVKREWVFKGLVAANPHIATYLSKTTRRIPVLVFDRTSGS